MPVAVPRADLAVLPVYQQFRALSARYFARRIDGLTLGVVD